jgi:hypothetical protein
MHDGEEETMKNLCHHIKIQLGYGIWGSSKPQLPGTALCSVEKQKQNKISKRVKDYHTSTNFHFKN